MRVLLGVGMALVGVGLLFMHGVSPDSEWTTLLVGFIVSGIGVGIVNPAIGQAAIAVVPLEKSGMGSGINSTFRQVGIATGVAGLGAVFQSQINSKLGELLPKAPHGLGEIVASSGSRGVAVLHLPPALHAENRARRRRRLRRRLQLDPADRRDPLLRRRRRRASSSPGSQYFVQHGRRPGRRSPANSAPDAA